MANIRVEDVVEAGVVGAGGAGFPTHVKLAASADTVVINAAECEPLLHKDKEVLRRYADAVLDGLVATMQLVGAEQGIIGIKEKYQDVIDLLQPMLPPRVTIKPLRDAYPAGDEFLLVYETLGRVIPPGAIPLAVGAVVMNVETVMNVALAAKGPVVAKFISVAGAVAEPITLRVPVGITLAECVAAAGGVTIENPAYIVGGVMMGTLAENLDMLVDKTTGGVIVLPDDHVVVQRFRRPWKEISRIARSACDQCSFCTELCPRWLLGHPVEPHRAMRSVSFNQVGEADVLGAQFCVGCNLCSSYSCPEGLDPMQVILQNRQRLNDERRRYENPPFNAKRPELHMDNRKAPTSRLMRKLDLLQFRNVGPLCETTLATGRVGIALKQHIGAPCEAVVAVGDAVVCGQVVGRRPVAEGKPALGAPVHASIDGVVRAIDAGIVWIER